MTNLFSSTVHARTPDTNGSATSLAVININVTSRHELDGRLDEAVRILQEASISAGRQGIMVTRHRPGTYTAALSNQVPFGMTYEHFH